MKRHLHLPVLFQKAIVRALSHDALNLAQSCAYSAIVSIFPALIVAAAVIGSLPDTGPVRSLLSGVFDRLLPTEVSPLLQSYFVASPHNARSSRVLLGAVFVSVTGASSVMSVLMEGFRRASGLPRECWSFWARRRRAYALVPLSLLPLALASGIVVFGNMFAAWLAHYMVPQVRIPFLIVALLLRWGIALSGSVGLIALIYRLGTPVRQDWQRVLPGATAATLMWFLTTLAFGWYVTRFANYSQVYGSLGAGIALLFWLYIVSLSVLTGAEFNMLFCSHYFPCAPESPPVPGSPGVPGESSNPASANPAQPD